MSQGPNTKVESISEKATSAPSPSNVAVQAHAGSPYRPESQNFVAAHRPSHNVSSSIASNLASARGIPSNKQRRSAQVSSPAVAQQQAEGKIVNPPRRSKIADAATKATSETGKLSEKISTIPHIDQNPNKAPSTASKETPKVADVAGAKSDDAFNRFYNTFESLFSKLSAPLAFAGLPLNPDSEPLTNDAPQNSINTPKTPARSSRPKNSRRATAEPEYSRIFSPAALAAVREEPGGSNLGTAESFYVVPTTGGTMQYANILARHQNQQQQQQQQTQRPQNSQSHHNRTFSRDSTGLSEDMDEFVDARETPGPPSPHMSRKGGGGTGIKSTEELQLENESLRSVLDEMSRRLWQFEMGAQMGSVALQQSIRASLNRNSGATNGGQSAGSPAASEANATTTTDVGGDHTVLEGKVAGLEDEVGRAKKELERMGRENEKLKGVVGRYRERWEKLKEGARTRRGTGGSGGGGPSNTADVAGGGRGDQMSDLVDA